MVSFSETALVQFEFWIAVEKKIALRILKLIQEIQRDNFKGIGKPEPLKGDFKGYWSRRIDNEHRLVYKIEDGQVIIHSCRFHYSK